jgi:galactose mutarotase-like enzyme
MNKGAAIDNEVITIAAPDGMSAAINPRGAELWRLQDASGRDLLWDGDPAFWTGRAPILFPVIGCLRDGKYRYRGREWMMPKHGFARHAMFALVAHGPTTATLRLDSSDATRALWPFEFELDVTFVAGDASLGVAAHLRNTGTDPLPLSFGFHPALRWPVDPDAPRETWELEFDQPEPGPILRLDSDGLIARQESSPLEGRRIALRDDLFLDDAMIFAGLASRGCTFLADGARGLRVDFPEFPDLGVWTKPGAGYLCIEPWQGMADAADFTGDIFDRPGVITLAAGEVWRATMTIATLDR